MQFRVKALGIDPASIIQVVNQVTGKKFCLTRLFRKSDVQVQPDQWVMVFHNEQGEEIGHLLFQANDPLAAPYPEELDEETTFLVVATDMAEFKQLCSQMEVEIVRVD